MKKRGYILAGILLFLFVIPFLSSASNEIDKEIQKVNYYAKEYETGNINYIQLLIYSSSVREKLNEYVGATKYEGGILKQDQVESILGKTDRTTKWVWAERLDQEVKLEQEVPVWERLIFDGKKIQININAYPSLFVKKEKLKNKETKEYEQDLSIPSIEEIKKDGKLIYRLHLNIRFKESEESFDIENKIEGIKTLAQDYNSNPTKENAENLAKESVNTEKIFESYFRQKSNKCEDLMNKILGSLNQKESQKILVHEIEFFEGENFEVIARLEMCDDCRWNWIGLNFNIEGRGPSFKYPKESNKNFNPEMFENKNSLELKQEIKSSIEMFRDYLQKGDLQSAVEIKSKLFALNDALNRKSNEAWKEVDKKYESKEMNDLRKRMQEGDEYYWIKERQERMEMEKDLRRKNHQGTKEFYLDMFKEYEKKEFYYEENQWEKRLIEEFKEFEKENCENNLDDNNNGNIDCEDDDCGGKICGKEKIIITQDNETKEQVVELYCIKGECVKNEEIVKVKEAVCGNHICEEGERSESRLNLLDNETNLNPETLPTANLCPKDCTECTEYPPLKCEGKVIFSGQDKNGCPLEPVCITSREDCETNDDCVQPLCGKSECVIDEGSNKGNCQTINLEDCRDAECTPGDKKTKQCISGEEKIIEDCIDGIWINTGLDCEQEASSESEIRESEEIETKECETVSDCGGENDVCDNGKCIAIPQNIQEQSGNEIEEKKLENNPSPNENQDNENLEETIQSDNEENPKTEISGNIIFNFFKILTGKIIHGFDALNEEQQNNNENSNSESQESDQDPETKASDESNNDQQDSQNNEDFKNENLESQQEQQDFESNDQEEERREEEKERKRKEKERKERELEEKQDMCDERCKRDCKSSLVIPCVEKCMFPGEEEVKDLEDCKIKCEKDISLDDCVKTCFEKCIKDENIRVERPKEENKFEKGVFKVGGTCRISQGKTEGHIYFDGWGDPFKNILPLKNKYYEGGNSDWCKKDLQNLINQRKEFEKGFNQDFAVWFFEKNLVNSAEDWELQMSGIFELYWKSVDNQREIAHRMKCLDLSDINEIMSAELINISYNNEYGSLNYWEELKEVEISGIGRVKIISPYMKLWIFPPKEFIIYEMKKSMKEHEFPGSPEEKMDRENEEGLTSKERELIKQDKKFMRDLKSSLEKYNGELKGVIQFKDEKTQDIVFNLYVKVNEEDIFDIKPMPPEEVSSSDVTVEIDFSKIYDLILSSEKEMKEERIESPPWDKIKIKPLEKINEIKNGIEMYFKIRNIANSAKISPNEAKKDVKKLFNSFFKIMMKNDKDKSTEQKEEINFDSDEPNNKS
jgi:hypothetical protein